MICINALQCECLRVAVVAQPTAREGPHNVNGNTLERILHDWKWHQQCFSDSVLTITSDISHTIDSSPPHICKELAVRNTISVVLRSCYSIPRCLDMGRLLTVFLHYSCFSILSWGCPFHLDDCLSNRISGLLSCTSVGLATPPHGNHQAVDPLDCFFSPLFLFRSTVLVFLAS